MENLIPSKKEFIRGIEKFREYEKRDAMYNIASFLVSFFWNKPLEMSDSLGVLLLTWNQAFYRYGSFDFDKLQMVIEKNLSKLNEFRERNIETFSLNDEVDIKKLFNDFLDALRNSKGESPVAVAKALHLLAPNFFPLWDKRIAKAYECHYSRKNAAEKYIKFMKIMKQFVKEIETYKVNLNKFININNYSYHKTYLKLIDEYNYSKYTKHWI
jgi:hypothetical protein